MTIHAAGPSTSGSDPVDHRGGHRRPGARLRRGDARVTRASTTNARATTIARILRFVEWTGDTQRGDLKVAVVGNPSLAAALRYACAAVRPGGRTVTVVDVDSPRALADANASVLVVGSEAAPLARRLSAQGVLTVGDGDSPDDPGLMLNLLADGDRYRFSANPAAAARAGVSLSSRLLRLAQIVN